MDFNTVAIENTEIEQSSLDVLPDSRDTALDWKVEIRHLKRFGGVYDAGGIECGKISSRENAAIL
jgi:hypothetical protein